MSDDPEHEPKTVHMIAKINQKGGVSPVCAWQERTLDLTRETWINDPQLVTCPKCRDMYNASPVAKLLATLRLDY